MGLFNIFRIKNNPKKSVNTYKGLTIFYHEDDFRQVEIIPNDNLEYLKSESEIVESHAKENFDVFGFANCHARSDKSKIKLNQRQIKPDDLEKKLSTLELERIPIVLTGYGQSYRELHADCVGFGKDYTAVYYDFKDNFVEHIWMTNHWHINREKLSKTLNDLGEQYNLLLHDWNLCVTVDLKNKNSIEKYLQSNDEE